MYRRVESFAILDEQLAVFQNMPSCPNMNGSVVSHDNMESCRLASNQWLQVLIQDPIVLRTPVMYQFLCAEANCPPPNLEIVW